MPVLDAERWFKRLLVALIEGRVDADGGSPDDFERQVVRFVPYHPAGRRPEDKLQHPELAPPGPALEGERALCEALAALPTLEARYRRLYDEDEVGLDARLSDPVDLGEAYNPATVMGPEAGWPAVAAWGAGDHPALSEALARTLPARWVLVSGRPEATAHLPPLLDALATTLGDRVVRIALTEDEGAVAETLAELAEDDGPPLVLVGEEAGLTRLLHALPDNVMLRDRTLAVVSVGGVIRGRTDESTGPLSEFAQRDWLGAKFRLRELETDVVRLTPYISLQWLDRTVTPPGIPGLPLAAMRFPQPDPTDASAETVEVVDLGPLPADLELPVELVARALVVFVSAWVATRR